MKSPQHRLRREAEQPGPARGGIEADQRLGLDALGRMAREPVLDRTRECQHVPPRLLGEDRPGDGAAFPAVLESGASDRLCIDQRGPAGSGRIHLLGPAVLAQGNTEMLLMRLQRDRLQMPRRVCHNLHRPQPLS